MDISSGAGYPAGNLSNFHPHPFEIDGVQCASMEGFLQSLKFSNPDMQVEVCKLVGRVAKARGSKKNWQRDQTLYWRGQPIKRESKEYQTLLDRAYTALTQNENFRNALLATNNATLTHFFEGRSAGCTRPHVWQRCRSRGRWPWRGRCGGSHSALGESVSAHVRRSCRWRGLLPLSLQ